MECRKTFSLEVQNHNTSSVKPRYAFRAITTHWLFIQFIQLGGLVFLNESESCTILRGWFTHQRLRSFAVFLYQERPMWQIGRFRSNKAIMLTDVNVRLGLVEE